MGAPETEDLGFFRSFSLQAYTRATGQPGLAPSCSEDMVASPPSAQFAPVLESTSISAKVMGD